MSDSLFEPVTVDQIARVLTAFGGADTNETPRIMARFALACPTNRIRALNLNRHRDYGCMFRCKFEVNSDCLFLFPSTLPPSLNLSPWPLLFVCPPCRAEVYCPPLLRLCSTDGQKGAGHAPSEP